MTIIGKDPRVKQALATWSAVAPELGLNPEAFRAKLIWQKDEAQRSHVVIRLKGPRRLVLKCVFSAPDDAGLPEAIAAQRRAFDCLAPFERAHVPEVIFASDDGRTVIMSEASGKTLDEHLRAGRAHDAMLRRTGAWLSAFHESGGIEKRTYQPRYMVTHVARMADAVAAGTAVVALPDLFMAACARIVELAEAAQGQQTVSAVKHGDFNVRNVLLGPDGETGLDFKPVSSAPVGFDIARLLMDYAELYQPRGDVHPGALLSDRTLAAFFEGYTVVTRHDPAVQFLPFVQLLNDWRLIPGDPARRSWRQRSRMDNIEALARNGFDLT